VGSKGIPKGLPSRGRGQRPYQEYYDEKYFTADAPPQQRPPPTPHVEEQQHGKLTKPSPVLSFTGSVTSSVKDGKEKKKKKGLFRF
jgi:syntaxin-binding protein 1